MDVFRLNASVKHMHALVFFILSTEEAFYQFAGNQAFQRKQTKLSKRPVSHV